MAAMVLGACSTSSALSVASPSPAASPSPPPSPLPCVQPAALPRAAGVTSSFPVILMASGLSGPDDLLYVQSDGSVLVGEHGDGHIARITAPGKLVRLPQVVPEAEGIAQLGDTIYVADQFNARIVQLTDTGMKTILQLQPVASGENLDGIAANGSLIVVPDSPHGTVLFVDPSGKVVGRDGGYSRPAGAWASPRGAGGPWLIADENASAVFGLKNAGGHFLVAGGLPGVDDVVRTDDGQVIVTLPGLGRLYDVSTKRNLATGLRNPQGLDLTGAQNLLVTESDSGRVLMIVRTFALQVPAGPVQVQPGQPICVGVVRAPGYTANLNFSRVVGGVPLVDPGATNQGSIVPSPCNADSCSLTFELGSGDGAEIAHVTYRD